MPQHDRFERHVLHAHLHERFVAGTRGWILHDRFHRHDDAELGDHLPLARSRGFSSASKVITRS